MTAVYPGLNNVYLISHDATNNLIVSYSRNPKDFALNSYIQIAPVTKMVGAYLRVTAEEAARIVSTDLSNLRWPDGAEAPMHEEGLESHEWQSYRCERYARGFNLGDLTIEQATWDIVGMHAAFHAQGMMTARTQLVHTLLATSGSWLAAHTATATVAGGGKWDVSSVDTKYIKKSFRYAEIQILKATLGVVRPKDLVLVINPEVAAKMSESDEVHQYIKESPDAMAQLRGDTPSQNGKFGLPDFLYGLRIVIEDAVKVSTPKGGTATPDFICSGDEAYLLARVGGIEGKFGSPSFTTVSTFMKEEMTVETKRDDDNRRTKGRVVENYDVVMTAPSSGFRFSDIMT